MNKCKFTENQLDDLVKKEKQKKTLSTGLLGKNIETITAKQNEFSQTEQTALKHCVPLPETCQALDWKGETLFYWVKHNDGVIWKVYSSNEITSNTAFMLFKEEFTFIPAPNAGELFKALPKMILFEDNDKKLQNLYLKIHFVSIAYCNEILDVLLPKTKVKIKNDNLADALARLYIKLQEANLLK